MMAVGLLSLLMTGCTTYSYTSRSTSIHPNTISSKSLGAEVVVDFSRRVTATSDAQVLKIDAINDAQYKCIQANNIDVIVDPIYKFEFNMFQKRAYKVTVTGFAGTYKQAKVGVDEVVEKQYNIEDIEKYKLLTDPSFYQYYYQKDPVQGGDVTNYFINSNGNGGAPVVTKDQPAFIQKQPASVMFKSFNDPAKQQNKVNTKVFDYQKSKKLRDAGIGLTVFGGVTMFVIGGSMMAGYEKYHDLCYYSNYNYRHERKMVQYEEAHLVLCPMGLAFLTAGIPMWAVGSHRMKKASDPQLAIGGTNDGLGMRLTF